MYYHWHTEEERLLLESLTEILKISYKRRIPPIHVWVDNVEISHPGGTGATTPARTRSISKVAGGDMDLRIPPNELRDER